MKLHNNKNKIITKIFIIKLNHKLKKYLYNSEFLHKINYYKINI